MSETVIIGAGPAGLTAAWELARLGRRSVVFEADELVGGISRTVEYKGYRFDIGGHRFFTKVERVNALWREILGDEFLVRPRLSRIFYGDRFFDYPLKPMNALLGLGPIEAIRIGLSYLKAQVLPHADERTFEQWVTNRFGRRLFEIFFETYTEKVWGMPCSEIGADWAAQRIKNLDLVTAVRNALLGSLANRGEIVTTLIDEFHYPRHGPGQMWESAQDQLVERGTDVVLGAGVVRLHHAEGRVRKVTVREAGGQERDVEAEHVLSSMPIRELLHAFEPSPPPEILAAADRLRYRDFLTVGLIVDRDEVFPDNWIYIHSPDVKMGRIQNFKNWSPYMVADPERTCLGLEYFVQEGDELWAAPDDDLIELGTRECDSLGLIRAEEVRDGCVIRIPKAYPVYDAGYQGALEVLRGWLDPIENLQLIGRNGQHRYNNQDHSMMTAVLAVENIVGASHDVWSVNVDDEYHEEVREESAQPASGDRLVPGRAELPSAEEQVLSAFARYDPVALGAAVGAVAGIGLFLATATLLVRGGILVGNNLSLLANYFLGYNVTWAGALVGLGEASLGGFAFGWLLARTINAVVGAHETALIRRLELARTLDPTEVDS
jgi:protoporphyrinogen oxidase